MKMRLLTLSCALILLLQFTPPASALEGEALRSADILSSLNLVQGASQSNYALDAPATRAQAAVLLVRLAGKTQAAKEDPWFAGFDDLPAWAAEEIDYAAHQGWVKDTSTYKYSPETTVTADDWFAMLLRMLGYSDADGDFTADDAAAFARRIGLTSQGYSGQMTRGDVFSSMVEALSFSYREGGTVIEALVAQGSCSRSQANALGLLNQELTARQIADRHLSAVFGLKLYESLQDYEADEPFADASGFFITSEGLAVTNYHSIDGALYATATLSTGEVYPVETVVYYDADIDIAVLQISPTSTQGKTTSAFSFLEVVGTDDVRLGDTVYTLGNPLGLGLAVSSGLISGMGRIVERYALPCIMNTADISQGSSGGALLNVYGQVVAVTSGAYLYGNNMYLAVPADPILTADLTGSGKTLAQVKQEQQAAS